LIIVFVIHEGDIVQNWNNTTEWSRADTSMSLLDGVVPYSIVPGDHDHSGEDPPGSTEYYELYFPASRFTSYSYWGGSFAGNFGGIYDETYPHTNNNNYQLLTIGGQDYIFYSLDFCPSQDEMDEANRVLGLYSDRKAILTTHALLDTSANYYGSGDFWLYPDGSSNNSNDTSLIWYDLITNHENLQLVLCGHMHGEARRTDDNSYGKPVHQVLADYQGRTNGGNGWLRIMEFVPGQDKINVYTYSPYLDQYESDANSEFTLDFPMSGSDYQTIGQDTAVPSGTSASMPWPDLNMATSYEWYVSVSDGVEEPTEGPTWSFTTYVPDTTPPTSSLIEPLDNGPEDLDADLGQVTVNTTQTQFRIQLSDVGNGIDDNTVTSDTVTLTGAAGYTFGYDDTTDVITLSGAFDNGNYVITLNGDASLITDLSGNPLPNTDYSILIDTSIVPPETISFQQGVNSYASMVDTMIRGANSNTNYADSATNYLTGEQYQYDCDLESGGSPSQVLYRFDNIIGGGADQIPPGAIINSAILRLYSVDDGGGGKLHRILQSWIDTDVKWDNSFGADGIQADDTEAVSLEDDGTPSNSPNTDVDLDVTATLQEWANGTATNNGWALLPNTTNGWRIYGAEHPTADYRPELIVEFLASGNQLPTVSITSPTEGATFTEGDNVTINATASDSDGTITKVEFYQNGIYIDEDTTAPYSYTWMIVPAGNYALTAKATDDGGAATTSDPVNITVNIPNLPPVASDDAYETEMNTQLSVSAPGVLGNDTDINNDPLTAILNPSGGVSNGQLTFNANGSFTYTPNADYIGSDSFTYWAYDDGSLESNLATVDINVTPVNLPPVANNDAYTMDQGTTLSVSAPGVLNNDMDPEYDSLSAVLVNDVSNGNLTLNTDGAFTYTPDGGHYGSDSFTYQAYDGSKLSNIATVDITINSIPVDDVAASDIPVHGVLGGSYADTHASDGIYETIMEKKSIGKPPRHSTLEHQWTFNVTGGETVTFNVEAFQTDSDDLDTFDFAYSTDGANFTHMLNVNKTEDNDEAQSYTLPASTSGTIYIRVTDTDHTDDNLAMDTISIDQMYIRCAGAGEPDLDPPTPDPMTWSSPPAATGETSISMTASTASDPSGVEYKFTCTDGGGHDSLWQDSPTYEDTGLSPSTTYAYMVEARDKSPAQNATGASLVKSATTNAPDTTPPTPNPMTWAEGGTPQATGSTSISMTATSATDPSGVEYKFTCIAGGGHDSLWQDSATYEDTGLSPNTEYTYTVTARDKSPAQNETDASSEGSATTPEMSLPEQADDPNPSDNQINVNRNSVILSWIAGDGATSHDVYLGTNPDDLPPVSEGQPETTYDPPTLDKQTIYYWRIDEVNDSGTTTGVVWSFTTN
jgi:Big-like domain-containing protein